MKNRMVILGLLALVLLIAACVPAPQIRNDKLLRDTSLLSGEPCRAPCWRGITPGVTTWREAQNIIEDTAEFTKIEVRTDDESDAAQITWQQGEDGQSCCVIVSETQQTADRLFLQLAPEITMAQMTAEYGEPTYAVGAEVTKDQAVINLVYPEYAMVAYAFVAGAETGAISAESEIVGVLFVTSDDMELLLQTSSLHNWEGYQAYSAYTPDEDEATFDVTPSITLTPEDNE